LAGIRGALKTNDADKALRHCALFHHAFAHAHPFNNINNSIAMNIVNDLLRKAGIGVLPHLYFDQLAYFVQPNDYVEFFEIAVRAHVMNQELGHNRPMTGRLLKAIVDNPS
jgi:Fic family protein